MHDAKHAPLLIRYGLLLTSVVYLLAAVTLNEVAVGHIAVWQVLYLSISTSGIWLWFRPHDRVIAAWHVAIPTALIVVTTIVQIQRLFGLIASPADFGFLDLLAGFAAVTYIGVAQYVFLPLSIAYKAGPR